MSQEHPSASAPCSEFREEIPLLAVGAMDPDCAAVLKKHLAGCAACASSYRAHCNVLETVKREAEPDRPLDTERVLARLRERIGEPPAAEGAPGRERPLALFASVVAIALGVLALLILARPRTSPQPIVLPTTPNAAIVYTGKSPNGREVKSGESFKTGEGSARFRIGKVEVRLKAGGELRLKENGIELLGGTVAVSVPDSVSFDVLVPQAKTRVLAEAETRFAVELTAQGQAQVTVAEGQVILEHAGGQIPVTAGKRAGAGSTGVTDPVAVDPRTAFGWLAGELYEGLKLELAMLRPARVVLQLRNTSNGPVSVTGYHPLGVNYQLEILRPGATSPEFVKLAPSVLRLQRAPGIIEVVHETLGQFIIEPDQSFELEMALGPLLNEPGTYRVAAEYLGFGPSGGRAAELGLLLRSNEVQVLISPGPPGKGISK